ncbi:MAG: response regulator, partial [Planctomycetales bacterium]|nr:response regulator [Planctomycetales bacterium]
LLDLSRIESGKLELARDSIHLPDLLKECFNSSLVKAEELNVQLHLQIDAIEDVDVVADRRRLRQVIVNLMSNAVKFSPDGEVWLRARRRNRDGAVTIAVADTGCGIATDDLPRLFEPFSQIDNSNVRKHEGTGLGLAITRQLTQQMQGKLRVRSVPQRGAVFSVRMPCDNHPPEQAPHQLPVVQKQVQLRPRTPRLDGRHVLVIDDRRDIRFIAEHILRNAGAEVDVAEDGLRGIEMSRHRTDCESPYDCIVTDIQMPYMDGYETTRRLRQTGYGGPILALTAKAMAGDRDECLAAGCNGYLSKPIDRVSFIQSVAGLLQEAAGE